MAKKAVKKTPQGATVVNPFQRLVQHSAELFHGKSTIVGVKVAVTAIAIDETNNQIEVPMGEFEATPRQFSSGNVGFYVNGKITDPFSTDPANPVRYQVGGPITAIKSNQW